MNPQDLLFAKTHEWVRVESGPAGKTTTVGLSDFALKALTDLVFINLPETGSQVEAGQPFGEIESVKAVSDLYSPVDGEVVEVNTVPSDDAGKAKYLERLSQDPYGTGWMVKIRISDEAGLSQLLDYAAYQKQAEEEGGEA
jgi:glycine cleavage system H protein